MASEDQNKEIDPQAILGATGLVRNGDTVMDEWHRKLQGREGARVFREMGDNDATIGSILYIMKGLVKQVAWHVEPADSSDAALKEADFVEGAIEDMSHTWADFMGEMISQAVYGWANFEKIYKRRMGPDEKDPARRSKYSDGRMGWRKISIRSQESLDGWKFDDDGGIRGMWQTAAPDYRRVFIPIEKCILFRTELAKNNPEGRSLLRNAYRPWFLLKRIQELEAIGIERDLVGLPVLQLPEEFFDANASTAKKNALRNFFLLLKQIRRNEHEGVALPSEVDREGNPTGYKLGLLSTGGARQFDTNQIAGRYQRDIAMTMAMQFIFLGMDKAGSFALSSDLTDLSALALGAILDSTEETFHRYGTSDLMRLNGVPQEIWPRVTHGDMEKDDLARFADVLAKMLGAGALTPDSTLEDHIRQRLELPEADEEAAVPFRPPVAVGHDDQMPVVEDEPEEEMDAAE